MKHKLGTTVLSLLAIIILLVSCNDTRSKATDNLKYSEVEIYCTCVTSVPSDVGYIVMNNCTTPFRKYPSQFVNSNFLYYSSKDSQIVNSFKNMFFESSHLTDTLREGTSPSFMVLMKKTNSITDTLVFAQSDQRTFNFNEKYQYKYSFNVMDSIRRLLKKDQINCE